MKLRNDLLYAVLPFLAVALFFPLMAGGQSSPLPVPSLPVINVNNLVNITNFGAVGSATLTNTTAIQAAINSAATTNGGCTVEIPAGTFMSGPLILKSGINLQIDSGATLKMLAKSNWPNASTTFISGSSIHDVEISGSGTIDGNAHFGSSEWWGPPGGSPAATRPNFIQFSSSSRILIQDVTLQNPPTFHIMIKNNNANITVRRITIDTDVDSPNTDGFDIASTNVLIQDCYVSAGDDNVEIGGSQPAAEIMVTNCTFGTGHGVSMGSITSGGVSNVMVVNCTFSGTDYGIRLKSDNSSSGSGAGGLCQNFSFFNLGMTNIVDAPIVIYSYYKEFGTPTSITPQIAASQPVPSPVPSTTVIWRNIVFSNLTATVASGRPAGIIWGRIELPATNIILSHVSITASKSFDIYNAAGIQFADSRITLPAGNSTYALFNARLTVTNTPFTGNPVTLDGLTTNGLGNVLSLYNTQASLKNTNVFDDGPLTISASTLTVSNNFALPASTVLNYAPGTNTTQIAVVGSLALGGTVNVTDGSGFTGGVYPLLTYTGSLSGSVPTLGVKPAGYTYSFDTSIAGQVNLIVTSPVPAVPANPVATPTNLAINLTWSPSVSATGYNLRRGTASGVYPTTFNGLTSTNYLDAAVTNGVTYFYVVSATNPGGESANSLEVNAAPLPSATPTNIVVQASGNQLQLSWPQDHLGWLLEMQSNNLGQGLGTNWSVVAGSQLTNQIFIPVNPADGSVFLRLAFP